MTSFRRMAGPALRALRGRPAAAGVLRRQPNVVETGAARGAPLAVKPRAGPGVR